MLTGREEHNEAMGAGWKHIVGHMSLFQRVPNPPTGSTPTLGKVLLKIFLASINQQ